MMYGGGVVQYNPSVGVVVPTNKMMYHPTQVVQLSAITESQQQQKAALNEDKEDSQATGGQMTDGQISSHRRGKGAGSNKGTSDLNDMVSIKLLSLIV